MLGNIAVQQKRIKMKLSDEYGRFSQEIFNSLNLQRLFHISFLSRKRLIRRMMIKILQGRDNKGELSDAPIFHWMTSGGSSAAGHGSAYSDSYTAILENTVSDLFRIAGVKFKATNHAGDVFSGIELGLCMESVFGDAVDILSWDFTSSGAEDEREQLNSSGQYIDPSTFAERLGKVYPKLPFFISLRQIKSSESLHELHQLEERGLGIGAMNEEYLKEIILDLPDYNINPEMKPPAIRKIRCGYSIEGKESDSTEAIECLEEQFRQLPQCPVELYRSNINDGWKVHRLKGRLLGFLLMDMLRQATIQLDILEQNESRPLKVLLSEEDVESFLFLKTQASKKGDKHAQIDVHSWSHIKLKSTVCINPNTDQLNLPIDSLLQPELICDELMPFQHSYFTINEETGLLQINPWLANKKTHGEFLSASLVGFCLKKCYANQCQADDVFIDWSTIAIRVYERSVSGTESIGGGCYFLKSAEGSLVWDLSNTNMSSSGLKIIRVHDGGGQILLTSAFIIH
jgi:hypothetical protein